MSGGKQIAFVHPSTANGTLIELVELRMAERVIDLAGARRLRRSRDRRGDRPSGGRGSRNRALTRAAGSPLGWPLPVPSRPEPPIDQQRRPAQPESGERLTSQQGGQLG